MALMTPERRLPAPGSPPALVCYSRRDVCPATCPLRRGARQVTGYGCFIAAGAAAILAAWQRHRKRASRGSMCR